MTTPTAAPAAMPYCRRPVAPPTAKVTLPIARPSSVSRRNACARSPAPTGVPAIVVATVSESQNAAPRATTTTSIAAYFCRTSRRRPTVAVSTRPSVPFSSSPASDRAATATANAMSTMGASHDSSSTLT